MDIKYADSFEAALSMTATTQTKYSDWFDASWANELYSFATYAESESGETETVTVTIQRYSPVVTTGTDIASHTGLTADGSNEKVVSAKPGGTSAFGTTNKLGTRIRWKAVTSGTWETGNVITMTLLMYAKRN